MKPHVAVVGPFMAVQIVSFSAAANAQIADTSSVSTVALGSNDPAQATASKADAEETVKYPVYSQTPSAQDFADNYPDKAQTAHKDGKVTIRCRVSNLSLVDCVVTEEAPTGLGFGIAALKMARLFKIKPLNRDGVPVEGRLMDLRLGWRLAR